MYSMKALIRAPGTNGTTSNSLRRSPSLAQQPPGPTSPADYPKVLLSQPSCRPPWHTGASVAPCGACWWRVALLLEDYLDYCRSSGMRWRCMTLKSFVTSNNSTVRPSSSASFVIWAIFSTPPWTATPYCPFDSKHHANWRPY